MVFTAIQRKQYLEKNKEKIKQQNKEYYEKNKDEIKGKNKEYREKNKEKESLRHKIYRVAHKEELNAKHREQINCPCGNSITYGSKARHEKTQTHMNYLKQLQ